VKTEILHWDGAGPFGTGGSVYSTTLNSYNARDQVTRVRQYQGPDTSATYQDTITTYDGYARRKTGHAPQQQVDPNNSSSTDHTTWDYNPDDTVQKITDARGASQSFSYNARHLVTDITYTVPSGITATAPVSYAYDAAGNRTSMTDGLGAMSYNYDQLSRLTSETRTITGVGTYPLSYDYNLADELTSVTNPFGAQVGYHHDQAGRVDSITGSGFANVSSYASNLQYRAWGALKQLDYGNGRSLSLTYNSRLQPATYTVPGVLSKSYDYRADGRRWWSHDLIEPKFDRSYAYDQAGRITQALSGAEARNEGTTDLRPYKETFEYDALGHLTARPVNRVWAGAGGAFTPAQQTYQNERNTGWQYDADGNLTDSGYVQYTIDARGQATRTVSQTIIPFNGDPNQHIRSIATDSTRSYDGDGNSIKNVALETIHDDDDLQADETTNTTSYQVRSTVLGKVMLEVSSETGRRGFVYLGSEVIAWQLPDSEAPATVNWEHRDPSDASFRMTPLGAGLKDQAELDPLGTNAGTSNATASPSVRKSFKYPGFGDYAMRSDSQCTFDGFMQPCEFVLNAVKRGAATVDSVSVSGSIPNYMPVRVEDPDTYDPDREDPTKSEPNGIVTIHEHHHYELVYTGMVASSFEPRQPQNPVPLTGTQVDKLRSNLQKFVDDPECGNFINTMLHSLPDHRAFTTKYSGSLMDAFDRIKNGGGFWSGPLTSLALTNPMTQTTTFRPDIVALFSGTSNQQVGATVILAHEVTHDFTNDPRAGVYQHTDMARGASAAATSMGFGTLFEFPTTAKYGTGEAFDHALSDYYGKALGFACRKVKL
jgi:YD repeat-containing protein